MFAKLLLPFILIPTADLMVLWMISRYIGWPASIIAIILSGILGAWLASRQSLSVQSRIRERLSQNQVPGDLLTDGAMIFFAAGLLITPGVITDVMGLTLLVPYFRKTYKRWAMAYLKDHFKVKIVPVNTRPHDPNVVDGEVLNSKEPDESLRQS